MKKQLICATLLAASLLPASALASEPELPLVLDNSLIQLRYALLKDAKPYLSSSGSYSLYVLGDATVTKISTGGNMYFLIKNTSASSTTLTSIYIG